MPQLRMSMTDFSALPPVRMPEGYSLRVYREGDEAAWAEIMNSVRDMGEWTAEKVRGELTTNPRFVPEGMFFVTYAGRPVATATAYYDRPGQNDVGQLHMVATMPEHQGHGLARESSLAAVHFFVARGFREVYLTTDDHRLAAVKMYAKMGFKPSYREGAGPDRWAEVLTRVGLP